MMWKKRSSLLLLLLSTSIARAQAVPRAVAEKSMPATPRLIVAIIVDQFRYDYTTRFAARYTGGLHTLLNEGAVFLDARQDHFPTVTAPGHATFMTVSTLATSGIVANEWYDRPSGKVITSVEDAATTLLGGTPGAKGSSPHNLLVSTLGDEIKIADGGTTKVIGISMKDRAAILPAGPMADAAYWFDSATGHVVSSTFYLRELPTWVQRFNAASPRKGRSARPGTRWALKERQTGLSSHYRQRRTRNMQAAGSRRPLPTTCWSPLRSWC
jgi:hypothetical protein